LYLPQNTPVKQANIKLIGYNEDFEKTIEMSPAMMKQRIIPFIPFILFLVAIGYFLLIAVQHDENIENPHINKPAPSFSVPMYRAKYELKNHDLVGQLSLVHFFATDCSGCEIERGILHKLKETNTIPIYGIAVNTDEWRLSKWIQEYGNPYKRIGVDRFGKMRLDWGVLGTPETFIIDSEGTVLYRFAGSLTPEFVKEVVLPIIERNG